MTDNLERQDEDNFSERDFGLRLHGTNAEEPNPCEFDTYLPWACCKMGFERSVIVLRDEFLVPQSQRRRAVVTSQSQRTLFSDIGISQKRNKLASQSQHGIFTELAARRNKMDIQNDSITIKATYSGPDLIKITLEANKTEVFPRPVYKLIALIAKFYPKLSSITVRSGLDKYGIHEVNQILNTSYITSVCFDGCVVEDGAYNLLIDQANQLKELSLARCQIGDEILRLICERLIYPLPTSKILNILYLSSNLLTDTGVSYIAKCLRSNRSLKYINLAGNYITSKGAKEIFNSLQPFPLTQEEIIESAKTFSKWIQTNQEIYRRKQNVIPSQEKRSKSAPYKLNQKIEINGNSMDPFAQSNCLLENGQLHCSGNLVLSYLNLSYNHLTINSLKDVVKVLNYQQNQKDGIVNMRLDGNPFPIACDEFTQINELLERKLNVMTKQVVKRKN